MSAQQTSPVLTVVEYQRKWIESLNRGDVSGADEAFAPDCVIHITGGPSDLDVAGFKQMCGGLLAAFPDIRFTMEDQIVSGDKVAMRWFAEATHTGPLGAAPPTGKRVRIDGLLFDHVVDGRVARTMGAVGSARNAAPARLRLTLGRSFGRPRAAVRVRTERTASSAARRPRIRRCR